MLVGAIVEATVVNDVTGPDVAPAAFRAVTFQKYVVLLASEAGANDAAVRPMATIDGGLVIPNATSYVAAPAEVHVNVGVIVTPAAPAAGVTAIGVVGCATIVVNEATGPVVEPLAFF